MARATTLLETSLALAREWGDEQAAALALKGLGLAARAGGDAEGAFDLLREAELSFRRLGERREAIATVEGLACAAADLGRFGQALALAGFAAREREETGSVVPPVERGDLAAAVAVARAAVGEREAGRAGADGRAARSPDALLGG